MLHLLLVLHLALICVTFTVCITFSVVITFSSDTHSEGSYLESDLCSCYIEIMSVNINNNSLVQSSYPADHTR